MMKEINSEIGLIMWVFKELTEKQCSIEDAESLLKEYKKLCKMESSDGDLVGVSDMFRFGRYLSENYEWHDTTEHGEDRYKHHSGRIYLESTVWEKYIHTYYR